MEITKADITRAKQAMAKVLECERMLAENEACGIECDEAKLRCSDAKRFLTNWLEVHGTKPVVR